MYFTICDSDPSHQITYPELLNDPSFTADDPPPNVVRQCLYGEYTSAVHGYFGHMNRVKIPYCVLQCIRQLHPDYQAEAMGDTKKLRLMNNNTIM